MPVLTKRVSKVQREWLVTYEKSTGYEPQYQEELDGTSATFKEVARKNLKWFELHSQETLHHLEHVLMLLEK